MRRILEVSAVLDFLAFVGGCCYVIVKGDLPGTVSDLWNGMQLAGTILLLGMIVPLAAFTIYIGVDQRKPPMRI